MANVTGPYLAAATVIGYRYWKVKTFPPPIRLVGLTAVMGACGLIADANQRLGVTLAWGFVVAAAVGPGLAGNVQAVSWTLGVPAGEAGAAASPNAITRQIATPNAVTPGVNAKLNRLPTPQ